MVHQLTGLRVLVVEDDPDNADSLALLLGLWGHDVHICHTGADALRVVTDYAPHVVLLDIGLPGMSGWEVARRIRGADPVILIGLSGFGRPQDFQRARGEGLDYFLVKPADPEQLEHLLHAIAEQCSPRPDREVIAVSPTDDTTKGKVAPVREQGAAPADGPVCG